MHAALAASRTRFCAFRRRAQRLMLLSLFIAALAGCALMRPFDSPEVAIASGDPVFVTDLMASQTYPRRDVSGVLLMPNGRWHAPHPAVVMLHTSYGLGSHDWWYARRLRAEGYAVLVVDSFGPRGVLKLIHDQTRVSSASMLADAYGALAVLSRDTRIDRERIAVLGFSKGGIAALYAAIERFRARLAPADQRFALHIAYYPWCGLRLQAPVTTGAPIEVHVGANDTVTPPASCRQLLADLQYPNGTDASLHVHADSGHAFDHPLLPILGSMRANGFSTGDCTIRERADGTFVAAGYDIEVRDRSSLQRAFAACGGDQVYAVANPAAGETAWRISRDRLAAELAPRRRGER